jgi:peptidyl-prolyl cis-trans isomerase A (cyclophilin A)
MITMNRRFALLALPLLVALTAAGPAKHRAAPPPPPLGDTVKVVMATDLGPIELELDHKHAPLTVENFMRYVDSQRYDGAVFYRVMRLKWGEQPNGLVQGGLQSNPQKVFKPVAHEPTSQTGLSHVRGAISMARNAPGTAMADWSIMMSDLVGLDADPKGATPDQQAGFAVFGHVSSGMDVVGKIYDVPLSETKGQGVLRGQLIEKPVKILSIRRVPATQ